jgi:hypothetical protein
MTPPTVRSQVGDRSTEEDDPRLALIYQEALRGLLQQSAAVESLRSRAGTLIFAASFASSLLGSRALAAGLGLWAWLAIALLFAIGALAVVVLWPYYDLAFRFDPEDLLARYVDGASPATLAEIHRSLALRAKAQWQSNGKLVRRLREAFQLALVLLLFNILAWLFSIAQVLGAH